MAKKDTIAALKALGITPDETKTEKVLKAELDAASGTPIKNPAQAHVGKAERMRLHLEAQPKVAIMIPLGQGEAAGSTESFSNYPPGTSMHAGFGGIFILTVGLCASMQIRPPNAPWRSNPLCIAMHESLNGTFRT
jgi:hypothetical protein